MRKIVIENVDLMSEEEEKHLKEVLDGLNIEFKDENDYKHKRER